jgi:CRISPR-associated endonuclease/helicase Cas3
MEYWAKTTEEGKAGISVYDHMLNVGHVARRIAESSPKILERFHLQASLVGALAALHDLGKISPGFQQKCGAWLEDNDLVTVARNGCWDTSMEADHGKVTHSAIQSFLLERGIDRKTAKYVSSVIGAHHGHLNPPVDSGYRPQKAISETHSNIDWDAERMVNARMIWDHFLESSILFSLSEDSPMLWWLAGLTSVADWIGSDERFFPSNSTDYTEKSNHRTNTLVHALDAIGFRKAQLVPNLSFHDLFHDPKEPEKIWIPNEMQEKTLATVCGPGVYVVEAPMGTGKTEAALWACYHLLLSEKAMGIYFALPTQATSNRIHLRVNDFLRRIAPQTPVSHLIHGNSWLMTNDCGIHPTATDQQGNSLDDARIGRDWFASAKRAMIAPFGVGTSDQALLGIVAARPFFVRHFALAGKVVILDEVHSYDLYTGTLIDKLITTLEGLGCTVIVLSATLSGKRRAQIVSYPKDVEGEVGLPYPLISGRNESTTFKPVAAAPPKSRTVKIDFITRESAYKEAITIARKGGPVVWICDTIDAAQKQYQRFAGLAQKEFPVGLLHSRFPYWLREKLETEWMERLDKDGKTRCGCILVSTQIVEQSVDLDADFLISELAPTDMLLQRLGRLWRHDREQRSVDEARLCIIKEEKSLKDFRKMEAEAIIDALGGKARVYDPFVLLRTLQLWENYPLIVIPEQIRKLIESTYCDRNDDPKSWEKLFDERFAKNSNERFKAAMNSNYWQPQLPDAEGVQTRLNDMPTVAVVLCQNLSKREAVFIDGTSVKLEGDKFRLTTAQGIHKNLVKVPEYCFDNIEPCRFFTTYLYGRQSVGLVEESGTVKIKGLKEGTRLFYSNEFGLIIEKLY